MNPNNRAVLEKLKVEKAPSKHKKIKPLQSDKNIICKLTEKKKKSKHHVKEINEQSSNSSSTPVQATIALSAYDVELLKKTEVEMLHKIRRLKSRLKHFERRFDDAVKSDIITHLTETCNKTCEAIAVYDTAVQTCDADADKSKNSEQIEDLKRMIEQLNVKIMELAEMAKINQLLNIRSQTANNSSDSSYAELSRSLDHLERRIDRLIDYLEVQNRKVSTYMNPSSFTFGKLGDGDQLENNVNTVDQLFFESTEKLGCTTRKLQSVLIVNDPICPEVVFAYF